jgi:predicted alpha/beta superfamily hydrolase
LNRTFQLLSLSFFLCCLPFPSQAQATISIGITDSVFSEILDETRMIFVHTPQASKRNPNQKIPVVYLLDGENYFHSATGVISHLSEVNGNAIVPDMIVVGIVNTERTRDFTPTYDSTSRVQPTGGSEKFTAFLKKKLIPHINANYPTAPHQTLVGHSLGGLFVMNTLCNDAALFDAYVALDPSLWWDDMVLQKEGIPQLKAQELEGKSLFLGIANSLPVGMSIAQGMADTTYSSGGFRSVTLFEREIQQANTDLTFHSKYYESESHGSVPLLGLHDGLRFIFDYYKRPSFTVITDDSPKILEAHYLKISERLGYKILPPEDTILGLAWRSSALEQNPDRALVFLLLGKKYYPESITIFYDLGLLYTALGMDEKAEKANAKANKLYGAQQSQE